MSTWRIIDAAAREAGISRATIYRLIRAGLVQRYKMAGDARTWIDVDRLREVRQPRPKD